VAKVSIRATLRGAHEDLLEPLVVAEDGDLGPLEASGDGRATLRGVDAHGNPARHEVLISPLQRDASGGPRSVELVVDGWRFEIELEPEARARLREKARRDRGDAAHSGPAEVRAIIPGVVVSVAVAPGDRVEAGQQLLVVEAMKMQNELRAPRAGAIERVAVGERSTIDVGDLLVVIA
jgi:biotin carboxyl carrier protein